MGSGRGERCAAPVPVPVPVPVPGLALALAGLGLLAASVGCLPLSDAGPHVHYGWGEPIRLRHLYTAGKRGLFGSFLRIHPDGAVDASRTQTAYSLLEIKAVAVRTVAIKGVHSSRYLCMEEDGKLHGQIWYSAEDCAFEEEIRPDGYNVYKSKKYGVPVSLSSAKQRQQFKGRDFLPLSRFLPMINTVPVEPAEFGDYADYFESDIFSSPLETDSMDPFRIAPKLSPVKSPSFQK
ncbi:fibroblast growth factor 19 [Ornithorhynchus anatinus]|uniref:Fibroblast growth factor n=1 Tax=Ornithorhynchus anatinus TaxID=9258 RepID=F6YPA8_ORNAN|nr:fibroblast growth factor 19 [Ornithorhynchus anatinus]